jgi:hypothetical protein
MIGREQAILPGIDNGDPEVVINIHFRDGPTARLRDVLFRDKRDHHSISLSILRRGLLPS